jgi:hypothetical protein
MPKIGHFHVIGSVLHWIRGYIPALALMQGPWNDCGGQNAMGRDDGHNKGRSNGDPAF